MLEFWALTPAETVAAIEAASWRTQREQERTAWLAWHIVALIRTKKLPNLERLLKGHKTRKLTGAELETRRREHAALVTRMGRGRNRTR